MAPKIKKKHPNRIYMEELRSIINRQADTIRRWEASGRMPDYLRPKRDERNFRYWTKTQVYGKKGFIAWMDENDMRPGPLVTPPEHEARHLESLRKPKLLNGDQIRGVKIMIENGRSREYIIKALWPRTSYATPQGLETSLRRYFKRMGWYFPPKKRRPYPPPHLRMAQPGPKPKKGSKAYKRQQRLAKRRDRAIFNN